VVLVLLNCRRDWSLKARSLNVLNCRKRRSLKGRSLKARLQENGGEGDLSVIRCYMFTPVW